MNLQINVIDGLIAADDRVLWRSGESGARALERSPVMWLDLSAQLVVDTRDGKPVAFVLFDEEDFPESILTTRMVKRFVKKTGIQPEMIARSWAVARFPWGEIEFFLDPKQGDPSIMIRSG